MSIEIYDKGAKIKKDGITYFFLKNGSKNSYTCGHQYVVDDNFRQKFIRRDSRDSSWHIIAKTSGECLLCFTYWNAPTGTIYGDVRFGDKINIAYSLDKMKAKDITAYDEEQQKEINHLIEYYTNGNGVPYCIDLDKPIPENKQYKNNIEYCGKKFDIIGNGKMLNEWIYWNLDNL